MDGDDQKREFRVPSLNNKSKMASEPGSKVRSGHLTQAGSDLTHLAPDRRRSSPDFSKFQANCNLNPQVRMDDRPFEKQPSRRLKKQSSEGFDFGLLSGRANLRISSPTRPACQTEWA